MVITVIITWKYLHRIRGFIDGLNHKSIGHNLMFECNSRPKAFNKKKKCKTNLLLI